MNLNDVGSLALQAGLTPQQALAAMAIAQTEGGLNGGVGDNGQSYGPFQFYTGGQLKNFAQAMGVSMAQAGQIARTEPDVAVRWALAPGGYLGDTLRKGSANGLTGADLATFAQRYGQVSVSPERAGQNYDQLFPKGTDPNAILGQAQAQGQTAFVPHLASQSTAGPQQVSQSAGGSAFVPHLASQSAGSQSANQSAASSGKGYVFPVQGFSGQVQDHWGSVKGGSDLMAPRGTPILDMAPGVVDQSGLNSVGGNSLEVKGDDGNEYYYAHFDKPSALKVGQRVNPGDYIAPVGNTGDAANGPTHLHIGIGPSIKLGSDKYGGTGGDYDAVGLLQSTLANQTAGGQASTSSSTPWTPHLASDQSTPASANTAPWTPQLVSQWPTDGADVGSASSPSPSTSSFTPRLVSQWPTDGANVAGNQAFSPTLVGAPTNDQASLIGAPTNDYGMNVVPIGLQNPNVTPL